MSTIPSFELINNTTFGVEIEMTGITREAAARVCATVMGEGSRVEDTHRTDGYSAWSCFDTQGRKWKFVSDASIHTTGGSATSCELNTPPLTYGADMETLQELVRALRRAGGKTGAAYNCGIHVHVSGKGHTPQSIINLINLFYSNDELVRKSLGIAEDRTHWCQAIGKNLVDAVKGKKTFAAIEDAWYETYCNYGRREHYNSSRYHILNLHRFFCTLGRPDNTVEVRAFNATLHAGEVRSYVLLVLAMNASALTQRNIRAKKNPIMIDGNEKFAMRTWLNRMGCTGEIWKTPRSLFTKRLAGNSAWRFGEDGTQFRPAPQF